MKENINVGDVLVQITGYSMYIAEFYLVLKKTDKSITIQKCAKKTIGGDGFRPEVIPDKDNFVEKARCVRLSKYHGRIWDGKPITEDWLD